MNVAVHVFVNVYVNVYEHVYEHVYVNGHGHVHVDVHVTGKLWVLSGKDSSILLLQTSAFDNKEGHIHGSLR